MKFRNPKFGEITNHKRTHLEIRCCGPSSRNDECGGVWRSGAKRRGRNEIWGLGVWLFRSAKFAKQYDSEKNLGGWHAFKVY